MTVASRTQLDRILDFWKPISRENFINLVPPRTLRNISATCLSISSVKVEKEMHFAKRQERSYLRTGVLSYWLSLPHASGRVLRGYPPRFSPSSSTTSPSTHTLNSVHSGQVPCGLCIVQVGTSVPQTLLARARQSLHSVYASCQAGCDPGNNNVTSREGTHYTPKKGKETQTFSSPFTRSILNPSSNPLQFRHGPRVHSTLCGVLASPS